MNLAFVILGVVLIFVLYYFLYGNAATVLSNKVDLSIAQTPIPVSAIGGLPGSPRYSLEMWMYIYNFDGVSKYIVSRDSAASTSGSPAVAASESGAAAVAAVPAVNIKNIGIKIDGASPKLSLEYSSKSGSNTSIAKTQLITDNLPLQTWVHLIVSVDNSFVDVYMNGKLIKSFQDQIDTPKETSAIDYGIVNCYLAKLTRSTTATDPQTAWDNYVAGNGENPLAKYLASFGLNVTLQKNNQDYSKITVF